MNDSSKIKLLTATTALLVLLNVVIIGFMWFGQRAPRPGEGRGGPGSMIIRELKLTDEQVRQFNVLRDEHRSAISAINEKNRQAHDALFGLLKGNQDTSAVSDSLISQIAQNKQQVEQITFHHLAQVRRICTADQQKRFDELIRGLMSRLVNDGPPPPGR